MEQASTTTIPWYKKQYHFNWGLSLFIGIILLPFTPWSGLFLFYGVLSLIFATFRKVRPYITKATHIFLGILFAPFYLASKLFTTGTGIALLLIAIITSAILGFLILLWAIHPILGIIGTLFLYRLSH